jgi:hypothetical protein
VQAVASGTAGALPSSPGLAGGTFSYALHDTRVDAAHRSTYRAFLEQSRKQRLRRGKTVPDPETDVNLGMNAWAGLGKGDPNVQPQNDPLWLADNNQPARCTAFKGFSAEAAAKMAPHRVRRVLCVLCHVFMWHQICIDPPGG